jgi:hypothetical protein
MAHETAGGAAAGSAAGGILGLASYGVAAELEVVPPIDATDPEVRHPLFYEVMGRLSYDSKPPSIVRRAMSGCGSRRRSSPTWVDRSCGVGSGDNAIASTLHPRNSCLPRSRELLDAAAAQVEPSANADMRLLAGQ